MTRPGVSLESLQDDGALASILIATTIERRLSNTCVGVLANGRHLFAASDESLKPRTSRDAQHQLVRAGCLAKPMTATLVAEAVADKLMTWTAPVNDLLGLTGIGGRALSGVTIRQLLNHTHGLDASAIDEVPRSDGHIDAQKICEQLAARPIAAPGQFYSYASVGSWIAAAVLERIYSRKYSYLLSEKLLAASSPVSEIPGGGIICPATGGDLTVTTQTWLSFLESHVNLRPNETHSDRKISLLELQKDQAPLPGWSPAEQASCLGWKSYGGGWFGHNSNSSDASAVLRFNVDQQVAIVISAPGDAAFIALATMFGRTLPEFTNCKLPRLLKKMDCERVNLGMYTGIYTQARTSIVVTQTAPTVLSFAIGGQQLDEDLPACPLHAAADDIFVPQRLGASDFAFVQFVRSNSATQFDYVWNGNHLWRRAYADPHAFRRLSPVATRG